MKIEELKRKCEKLSEEVTVFGEGNINAKLILVGEAPGANEVEQKRPFVGKAGKNLDYFLEVLEIKREDIYITNVVKIRPYKINEKTGKKSNRPPNKNEIEKYINILYEEIKIIKPEVIVTLGNFALKAVSEDKNITIGQVHGTINRTGKGNNIFPLYHPAAIIYNQSLKTTYEEDLIKLKKYIGQNKMK